MEDAYRDKLKLLFDSDYKVYYIRGDTIIRGRMRHSISLSDVEVEHAVRQMGGHHIIENVEGEKHLTITIHPAKQKKPGWRVNLILFLLTVLSTLFAGAFLSGENPIGDPASLLTGISFSVTILAVLGLHELGHYLAAKRYKLNVTLPYFLPFPTIVGTLGAVIRMKSPIYDRRMLLDIGAAGPITGFVVSIPVTYYGLMISNFAAIDPASQADVIHLGSSLIFEFLSNLALGSPPDGFDVSLHPVAFAGWVGLFVTSLNLLPIGQLDGGHIIYSLLGRKQKSISTFIFVLLIALGVIVYIRTGWPGWFLWALLILLLAKIPHPPVVDDSIPVGNGRRMVGILTLIIFIITFIPNPITP